MKTPINQIISVVVNDGCETYTKEALLYLLNNQLNNEKQHLIGAWIDGANNGEPKDYYGCGVKEQESEASEYLIETYGTR